MTSAKSTTRSGEVYEQIKDEILRAKLEPGQRLRFVELAERFAVSQSVVREALTRLAGEGLATAAPQQGFRVVTLSLKDLNELTETRCEIEPLAFRYAIERGDLSWESMLVAAHHQLAATPTVTADGELNAQWFDVHERFHQALLAGCGNERLLAVALSLRNSASLYLHWSRPVGHDYDRDIAGEHRGLLEAAIARDTELASTRLRNHIERTTQSLLAATKAGPAASER